MQRGLLEKLFLIWDMKDNKKVSYKYGSCKRKFREKGVLLKDGGRQPNDR